MPKPTISNKSINADLRYLKLLARDFPTIPQVTTEIINLEAILHLPKPTEHFLADLHGENEAFQHVLRNASGNIKRKVKELFGNTLREKEIRDLCTLIYYPKQKLELVKQNDTDLADYYQTTLNQLIAVCRNVSSKYTRSKVRKSLPPEFAYIIEELLHESSDDRNKQAYVGVIIQTIIGTGRAAGFVKAMCELIQRLAIDQLHILGDIFDRGPGALATTIGTFSGVTTTYCGWELQRATKRASPVCYAFLLDTPTRKRSKKDMASTWCPWLLLLWKPMPTTLAPFFIPR